MPPTDQMGVAHYGYYAQFYEIGRTEAIRRSDILIKISKRWDHHAGGRHALQVS